MKILELANYSAGICGVWNRVKEESVLLSERGHEVMIFSSNFVKGGNEIAKSNDKIDNVKIIRFPATMIGGESFMYWIFEKEALKFAPDVIIAHSYRHLHTTKALKIAKKIGCRVFLVTHAPFVENDSTRSFIAKMTVRFYDTFIGPKTLNKFDKVIAITNWEMPFLLNLGVNKDKIVYIPNGIPEEFFIQRKSKEGNKVLFLGRISPIKDIETLINAMDLLRDNKIKLEIVGPTEIAYHLKLKNLVKNLGIGKKIIFSGPIYDLKEKIRKIDSAKIFVLPSRREAMPQALIEAMARNRIVITSNNKGSSELIINGKNGFLFRVGDEKDLAAKLEFALTNNLGEIQRKAKRSVEKFRWKKVIKRIESLI